jgi:MinD-like ATPase involved in chromosome partitioning or flagellar assembly
MNQKTNRAIETRSRIVFTQGGKGGVGKTTIITAFVGWARSKGLDPVLMDFDFENREKSSLQSFYGEAQKTDIHKPDALDKLFHNLETPGTLVIVDQGAGAGAETFSWFDRTAEVVAEFADVTSIGVVTKDPGSVESVLAWAYHLGDRVRYLIVLNELIRGTGFDAWTGAEPVKAFADHLKPIVIGLQNRNPDFEDMLRGNALTLERVIRKDHSVDWFKSLTRIIQARRYQQEAHEGFEAAAEILLPTIQD